MQTDWSSLLFLMSHRKYIASKKSKLPYALACWRRESHVKSEGLGFGNGEVAVGTEVKAVILQLTTLLPRTNEHHPMQDIYILLSPHSCGAHQDLCLLLKTHCIHVLLTSWYLWRLNLRWFQKPNLCLQGHKWQGRDWRPTATNCSKINLCRFLQFF